MGLISSSGFNTDDLSGLDGSLEASTSLTNDDSWLQAWTALLSGAPATPVVPAEACHVQTSLNVTLWREALENHPNQPLSKFFPKGITEGFRIGYNYRSRGVKTARRILDCAIQHKEVV